MQLCAVQLKMVQIPSTSGTLLTCALGSNTPVPPEGRGEGLLHLRGRWPRLVSQALVDLNGAITFNSNHSRSQQNI